MFPRSLLRLSLGLFLVALIAVMAPGALAAPPQPYAVSAWTAEYYNTVDLSGPIVYAREEPAINYFWPENTSPVPGWVNTSNYSIRWTRTVYFDTTGTWTFNTVNDDGMNVWVDNQITMNAWYDQGPTAHAGSIYLNAGWHQVKVEYYNRGLAGTAKVSWSMQGAITDWKGEYFNNPSLSGTPVLTRNDGAINFDWGQGSPGANVPANYFSARWTRTVYLDGGTYRLTITSDDGSRVYVDNQLMIDDWWDHPPTTFQRDVTLGAGNHTIRVEYYEASYLASVKFSYAPVSNPPPPPPVVGVWRGQYFANVNLSGAPAFVRDDNAINFNWGEGSPAYGFPADNFSVRWDGIMPLGAGNYTVSATSDDGVRVYADGSLLIDGWWDHAPMTFTATRYFSGGNHTFRVEYYERGGGAMINVQIGGGAPPPPTNGDIIIDDNQPGFQRGGCATCWRESGAGYGSHSFFTYNNTYSAPNYNWARWFPYVSRPGYYEVFVYIPAGVGNTTNARYWVRHNGQFNLAARNQAIYANQWVSLGTYYFSGASDENVSLTDVTYEPYVSRALVFDAVKFSPR